MTVLNWFISPRTSAKKWIDKVSICPSIMRLKGLGGGFSGLQVLETLAPDFADIPDQDGFGILCFGAWYPHCRKSDVRTSIHFVYRAVFRLRAFLVSGFNITLRCFENKAILRLWLGVRPRQMSPSSVARGALARTICNAREFPTIGLLLLVLVRNQALGPVRFALA